MNVIRFCKSLLLAAALVGPAVAAPITFDYVLDSAIPGGGSFTASVTMDDAFQGAQSRVPLAFNASISGNSNALVPNRTWDVSEIFGSATYTLNGNSLIISGIMLFDTGAPQNSIGYVLTLGSTGVSSPTQFNGHWALASSRVPDGGPGLLAGAVLVAMLGVARFYRR